MYKTTGEYMEINNLLGIGPKPKITHIPNIKDVDKDCISSLKVGGNIHKNIRNKIRSYLKPGLKLSTLAQVIESTCVSYTKNTGIYNGIGFPSSLSLDSCAAHFTPSKELDKTVTKDSVLKIDYGVEVNGWITDCAFTIAFNEKYNNLLEGVKEATMTGIKNAGVDVNIYDWSKDIEEVMNSYNIKPIKNLGGHNILNGHIHGGQFLPSCQISFYPRDERFKEGVYAIETFGSTKSDWVDEYLEENTIYMYNRKSDKKIPDNRKKFNQKITKNFKTLPFCNRYLDKVFENKKFNYKPRLNTLIDKNIYNVYPPLYDSKNGIVAQYEHTLYLSEDKKINFTQDTDY